VGAINKGHQLLDQAGAAFGEVLLITDGGTSPAAERAAEELRDAGYTLSVLGVGTKDGAPIPRAGGGFVTDRSGNLAVPRLEESSLRRLAASGGGRYATMTADDSDIDALLSGETGSGAESDNALATDRWQEEGPWLLLLLVPLAALAFRRGLVLVLVVFLMPVMKPAHASVWDDLWQTRDQQAQQLLESGEAEDAAALFDDSNWRAVANYRGGDYGGSAAGFADQEDSDSLYNLGNALARLGEFESAIDAYEEVLERDPNAEDAQYNRDLLQDMLEQSQDSQDGEEGNENSAEEGGGGEQSEGQSQSDQEGEEGSSGDPGAEGEEGDSSVRDEENMNQEDMQAMQEELERAAQEAQQQGSEAQEQEGMTQAEAEAMRREQEQQQAMEQWLRRIPNDPGGLLRRKFRYQYQRQGKDQDGNSLWPDDEVQPW